MANEVRLIDANALMDVIRQHEYPLATRLGSIDNGMFTLGIQQAVDEAPTVDAVEVVRCKDCKECFTRANGTNYCRRTGRYAATDDFCSYGERRDNERKAD